MTYRTKQKYLKLLIDLYRDTLKRINRKNHIRLLTSRHMKFGVCWVILKQWNVKFPLYPESWVKYWVGFTLNSNLYWADIPSELRSYTNIIKSLETRLFILEMEYYSKV
jgi:hypothetical protein